jgi:hypothetical protein
MEKYISFSLGLLRFIDSFQFLPYSLAGLVEDLDNENPSNFKLIHHETSRTRIPTAEHLTSDINHGTDPYFLYQKCSIPIWRGRSPRLKYGFLISHRKRLLLVVGFDLLMKGIDLFKNKRINVIPNNMEKYISFSLG